MDIEVSFKIGERDNEEGVVTWKVVGTGVVLVSGTSGLTIPLIEEVLSVLRHDLNSAIQRDMG